MKHLTPLAVAFLDAEDEDSSASLAIGSVAVFEGPPPVFEDFLQTIGGRLPLVPRYRQKLRMMPWGLAPPAWIDDPDFDIRWHIRSTALPAPGGEAELGRLLSRVMSSRMDRSRPLWEYWFCEGLAGDRWALVSKMHHCMADGVSATDLYRLVLDADATPGPAVTDVWAPAQPQFSTIVAARSLVDLANTPIAATRAAVAALRSPRRLILRSADSVRGLLAFSSALRPVESSSLMGPLSGSRRYAWTTVSLDDVRAVRHRFGGSVNDVALAVVSGGFRRLLLNRHETPTEHTLRSLVPVSTRAPGEESITDNRVSLMLPYLPVDIADPLERLVAVRRRLQFLRSSHEPEAGDALTTMAEYAAFPPVSWGMRLGLRWPQRQIATVTTNVPGPRTTLYGLGREVLQLLPYVPIADRIRVGVAIFSYRDALTFGITADYAAVPDIAVLADGISASLVELLDVGAATG